MNDTLLYTVIFFLFIYSITVTLLFLRQSRTLKESGR